MRRSAASWNLLAPCVTVVSVASKLLYDLPGDPVGYVGLVCLGVEFFSDLVELWRAWLGWGQVDADVHVVAGRVGGF